MGVLMHALIPHVSTGVYPELDSTLGAQGTVSLETATQKSCLPGCRADLGLTTATSILI